MPIKSYRQAINEALRDAMQSDDRVIIIGEDVASMGGVFGVTQGLAETFGTERVIDTPIAETSIIGAASGAALTGLRPIAELMFVDFVGVCWDQIYNQAAKFRYMFGGQQKTPLVIRTACGAGLRAASHHSQTLFPMFTATPGLHVVMPSNAYAAKGLLASAIKSDDVVIFLEDKTLYDSKCEVPDEAYEIPLGQAKIIREGTDVTIVAFSKMVNTALKAADELSKQGISCELIDPQCSSPFDKQAVLNSVSKTHKLIIVEEAPPRCNLACDVAAMVAEEGFSHLRAPIKRVTAPHTPIPYAPDLEDDYIPQAKDIILSVQELTNYA